MLQYSASAQRKRTLLSLTYKCEVKPCSSCFEPTSGRLRVEDDLDLILGHPLERIRQHLEEARMSPIPATQTRRKELPKKLEMKNAEDDYLDVSKNTENR